jgi:hypothetical protein
MRLPHTQVIVGTGDQIEEENLVEFRLLYHGILLPSAGTSRRSSEKHDIRKAFHPQLKRLWNVKSGLRELAQYVGLEEANKKHTDVPEDRFNLGLAVMGRNWNRAGFDFIPLVTSKIALRCSLDVLLLRPGENKYILEQGDIDGQLKTLFDALRIPKDTEDTSGASPQDNESPFFCLLEDDRLISEVHVTTDQLLVLPKEREVKANDTFVVIHVKVNHTSGSPFDRWFDT